jgi:hypothetical protein
MEVFSVPFSNEIVQEIITGEKLFEIEYKVDEKCLRKG